MKEAHFSINDMFQKRFMWNLSLFLSMTCLISCFDSSWKTASRESANLAPKPNEYKEAIVQIYGAKLFGMQGLVGDHTWISTKKEGAHSYRTYEILGWLKYSTPSQNSVLVIKQDIPDRYWYGNKPKILVDLRGERAKQIIDKIHQAAIHYPYKTRYSLLGPNSNTFTAWVACKVPELNLELSYRAVGKNYLKDCEN